MFFRDCFDRLHKAPYGQGIILPVMFLDFACENIDQILLATIRDKQPPHITIIGFDQLHHVYSDKIIFAKGMKRVFDFLYILPVPQIIFDFGNIDPAKDKHFLDNLFRYYITAIYERNVSAGIKPPFITCRMVTNPRGLAVEYQKCCQLLSLGEKFDKTIDAAAINIRYQKTLSLNHPAVTYTAAPIKCCTPIFEEDDEDVVLPTEFDTPIAPIAPILDDEDDVVLDESLFHQPGLSFLAPKISTVSPEVAIIGYKAKSR